MEEFDKIIIDHLQQLQCDIEPHITSLKEFDPDMAVAAISTCLEVINPQIKLPKKLPASMSAKIKFGSNLADQIKSIGFKGDMGYQTILYCNEVEVRRVLMFLLERLPKESNVSTTLEPIGYVAKIVRQIEESLKRSLDSLWLPAEATSFVRNAQDVLDPKHSCTIDGVHLIVPQNESQYAQYIPKITSQCLPSQLHSSILFETADFSNADWKGLVSASNYITNEVLDTIPIQAIATNTQAIEEASLDAHELKMNNLVISLKSSKEALVDLQPVVKDLEHKLSKIILERQSQENLLHELEEKVKLKNKVLVVLSDEETKTKLKNLIRKSENRLLELENQWTEVQAPLLEEHKALRSSMSSENIKQNGPNKLHNLKKTYKDLVKDFKQKSAMEAQLVERCKEVHNKNNREAYTRRILEIVGNIKKQNIEIQKILADTKQVQKDISNLTGQVDRSFTLSDEIIFRDCKHDEAARRAYKLLAALREECEAVLQAVVNCGQADRELRNLEDQLDTERNKNITDKLAKVQRDLAEIKTEIDALIL